MDIDQLKTLIPSIRPQVDAEQLIYDMLTELYADDNNVHIMVETNLDTSAVFYDDEQVLILFSCTKPLFATTNMQANRWKFTVSFTIITLDADKTFTFSADLAQKLRAYPYTQSGSNSAGRVATVGEASFTRQASSNQMNGKALKERGGDVDFTVVDSAPL